MTKCSVRLECEVLLSFISLHPSVLQLEFPSYGSLKSSVPWLDLSLFYFY